MYVLLTVKEGTQPLEGWKGGGKSDMLTKYLTFSPEE